ncbi:agmatine deiminase family protein [Terriglobus roseus]|uniref:Agmatine deiminase n=1 Tax=Terriglobus roseus TaxID=392734 RepID=A0A1G7IA10_9BACT|nr:agmatine deiminase family protein [Terriglobus roseus]SDF09561.1 agmatine deiminase [Terriglobus roseus]
MSNTDYRMPAEWDAHTSTWIAWPHNAEDWPGKFQPIPWVYSEIVKNLSQVEDVNILVNDERAQKVATRILTRAGANLARIHFHLWKTDRIWLRDSGPIFVKKANEVAITNWKFNAWAKYPNWHNDDLIPSHVAKHYAMKSFEPMIGDHRVVLEGGSIDVNGAGALLTTEECLLSEVQQRNPGISKQQLETCFHDYLGIDQVLWLNRGCAGDDTHGHVDDIARFTAVDTIVAATEHNTADENHLPLAENLDRLRSFRQPNGKPYNVIELPMPAPVIFDGERLPASYANFYIANDLVLVPTFNDANDRIALNILADQFPTRKIVGIHCGDFIWGLGALHCMTQQEPA